MRKVPAVLLLLLLGAAFTAASGAELAPGEYEVKAAFLYNFAKFVEWPPEGWPAWKEGFVITILGDDPFGATIDDTLQGKTVDNRRVMVRRARRPEDVGSTQILFISDSEGEELSRVLKRLEGAAILTVGQMDQFAERGGVIRFRMEKSRVRLEINPAAAERAKLKISSELLKLARIVGPGTGG